MSELPEIALLKDRAGQCFRLANGGISESVASELRRIGYEFIDEALKLGADPATMSPA